MIRRTKKFKSDIRKWCKALRSGKYKQARGRLQNENGFCCLGVACKIFLPKPQALLFGGLPEQHAEAPLWLKKINSDFRNRSSCYLDDLNDDKNYSFNEIADELERVYLKD